jgi:hypothetical protein
MKTNNGFGDQTYWNRPSQGRQRKLPSKYPSLKPTSKMVKAPTPSRSPSPTLSQQSTRTLIFPSRQVRQPQVQKPKKQQPKISKEEENDAKDEKSIC